ncbi:MAG: ribosome biogenesis GTPase Der [Thermoanaerobacteraceae bacterium]|nr:ribosome biogenesis GTPase Der [Thermoanaerobacteraceae bacterium]
MIKPLVAIVGRPNVGKSTLFNVIVEKRISIVDDVPGVTRDRIYSEAEWSGISFDIVDTGGIQMDDKDSFYQLIKRQSEIAIETADVILFVVDGKEGINEDDRNIADFLRKSNKPIILVCNKIDDFNKYSMNILEFYELGMGEPMPVSAANKMGIGDLLDKVIHLFANNQESGEDKDEVVRIAIAGRPNVGKSSLYNKIIGEERSIVSNIPGTTRDAIDTRVKIGEDEFIFIDTAGLRKKSQIKEDVERYSVIRSLNAIKRSDVTLLLIDPTEGVTEQDTKIAGYAMEEGKGIIIVVNKWDLIEKNDKTMLQYEKDIRYKLSFIDFVPIIFVSAATGLRVNKLINMIKEVYNNSILRIKTGLLNDVLNEFIALNPPPSDKGKRLKIFYMTQTGIKPPFFVLFVNDKDLFHFSYERYIENQLRNSFGFLGNPIKINIKERE